MTQTEIVEAQKLFKDFKLEPALQTLNKLSQSQIEELSIVIQLQFHTLKGKILVKMDNMVDALTSAENSYEIASKFEIFHDSIEKIDSFLLIAEILMFNGKYARSSEILKDVDKIINNLPDKLDILKKEKSAEKITILVGINYNTGKVQENEKLIEELHEIYSELGDLHYLARNYTTKGFRSFFSGDMDGAITNLNKSTEISSKIDFSPFFRSTKVRNLVLKGIISSQRGDLFESLEYNNEALNLAKKHDLFDWMNITLNNLGCIYFELADWDKTIFYLNEALTLAENRQVIGIKLVLLEGLFSVYLYKGDIKTAEEYLERIRKINDQGQNKRINQVLRFCEAQLLRMSKRTRDLGKAQEILKEISEEEIIHI